MKCWKSAFNAQGSRLVIVALQVGAMKIYAATVEALKKKQSQGAFTTKTEVS
jgi:predicted oxidoreductase (fatty acid repression mutant protein)